MARLQAKSLDDPGRGPSDPVRAGRHLQPRRPRDRPDGLRAGLALDGARPADRRHQPVPVPPRRHLRLRAARQPARGRHHQRDRPRAWSTRSRRATTAGSSATSRSWPTTSPASARSRGSTRTPSGCSAPCSSPTSSTRPRLAESLGPARWRELVATHNERIQFELDRYRGRLVKTTGDGVLALFDSSERAVRAAAAICLAAKSLGLAIRAGIHTGEVEIAAGRRPRAGRPRRGAGHGAGRPEPGLRVGHDP